MIGTGGAHRHALTENRRCASQAADHGDRNRESPRPLDCQSGRGLRTGIGVTRMTIVDPIIGQPDGTEAIDAADGALPHLWHVHRMLHTVKDGRVELSTDGGSYLVDGRRATDVEVRFLDQLVDSGYVEGDFFGDIDGRTVQLTSDGHLLAGRWRGLAVYTSRGGGRCG